MKKLNHRRASAIFERSTIELKAKGVLAVSLLIDFYLKIYNRIESSYSASRLIGLNVELKDLQ